MASSAQSQAPQVGEGLASVRHVLDRLKMAAIAVNDAGEVLGWNDLAEAVPARGSASGFKSGLAALQLADGATLSSMWTEHAEARAPFDVRLRAGGTASASRVLALPDGTVGWLVLLHVASVLEDSPLEDAALLAPALSTALQAAKLGLWEWTWETDAAHWNPEVYEILELPPGSGIEAGDRFISFVHPEDLPLVEAAIGELKRFGRYSPIRLRVRTAKGNLRWLVSCAQVTKGPEGAPPIVVGVNLDVTAEVEANARVQQAMTDLRQQQRIVESVLEHAPVGIAVSLKGDKDISLVSRYGLEMIECGATEGRNWDAWSVYHLDGATPAKVSEMALHRATEGAVIRSEEWYIRRTDGQLLPVSCDAGPILGPDGRIVGGVVSWYDVTPFKEADRKKIAALAAEQSARKLAEEANGQKDLFLGIVSHELRTPLSAILGWTSVLDRMPEPSLIKRGTEAISRNTKALGRLVDDLLDATRMSTGKLDLAKSEVVLEDVVSAAVETVALQAEAAAIEVQWAQRGQKTRVLGDALRLQQAFWNLLTNAVKFSSAGGLVLITAEEDRNSVRVEVRDFGRGLEGEHLGRVFDKFYQVSEKGNRLGGLGLGLALTKHIVEAHGGTIDAQSEGLGKGTCFNVVLPILGGEPAGHRTC